MTWVFAALDTAFGQTWIDFDVYMPECWAEDPQRRRKAGIPEGLAFATKPELAAEQLKRLMPTGVRAIVGRRRRSVRALRRVPGRVPGAVARLRRHHSLRL